MRKSIKILGWVIGIIFILGVRPNQSIITVIVAVTCLLMIVTTSIVVCESVQQAMALTKEEEMDVINTAANATANATAEVMTQAENIVNLTSGAASNATETAMDKTVDIASNASSNATGKAMTEANEIINAASNASTNVTNATGTTMTQAEDTTVETQTYENPAIGIRLSYPSDWSKIVVGTSGCQKETTCLLTSEGTDLRLGLLATSKEVCNCNSLKDFVRSMYESNAQAMPAFSFISDNQTTVGKKYPGWQYEYSFLNNDNANTKSLTVLTTNNETYLTIAFSYLNESQAKVFPQFKKVIDSIEFLPIQLAKTPSFMNTNETEQSKPSPMLESSPNGLQILSHNSFTDSLGYLHVVGEVQNSSPTNAQFVQVTGTFYDTNNQVVATDFTYTNPTDISSGQKAPFELILTSASIPVSQIDHYNLQASSQ